jgi:UDP-3-O-[3-hydroxymyristoyl] N-acetylglucosamine deacetylase/3-hydroxyacyl-[acyl-carrier-protein] dehydratase
VIFANETSLDVRRVLDMLPHRYPFVMVDRVLEFRAMRRSWR